MSTEPGGWGPVLVAAGVAVVVGLGGGLLTDVGPWYRTLRKPSWQPPDWLFGPVWTIIIALAAWSAVLGWNGAASPGERVVVAALFGINAVLNIAWSFFFFTLRRPDWALAEVAPLWLSILAMFLAQLGISTLGAVLLVPYLMWVGFAAYLNRVIVRLNGNFEALARAS